MQDDYRDDYRERSWTRDEHYYPEEEQRRGLPWRKILIGIGAAAGAMVVGVAVFLFAALQGLPSLEQLQHYEPPISSRVHAGDGALVAEFAREQRVFVPIAQIPDYVKNAFISAEDQHFFEHSGIDFQGLARAMLTNVGNVLRGRRMEGASTITQQVAGNMLTGREAHGLAGVYRKVREAVLAQRIERAMDKDRILELYLNQIYLGNRAFGVGAASLNYFDKPLDQLTLGEAAFLAVLPKGPGNYDPRTTRGMQRALERRDYVLHNMVERGYITQAQATAAHNEQIVVHDRLSGDQYVAASHFVEEIRRQVQGQYGEQALYDGGLSIRSTIDTHLQLIGARALRAGLEAYDRRHAWRGPVGVGDPSGDIRSQLSHAAPAPQLSGWVRAMITSTQGGAVSVTDENGSSGRLAAADVQWAAQWSRSETQRALHRGTIIYAVRGSGGGYTLKQVPELQGALVAMDPHTGRVLAMVGGYSFNEAGGLNRATQAQRQPGSSFKPIVYAAALDYGLTPATLVDDGPLSINAGDGSQWSPENYEHDWLGPTTLRRGLELSRNAMTARVAYQMGPDRVLQYGQRLGALGQNQIAVFSLALGAGETTLLRMTTAYGMFVNGGHWIQPIMIDRIQDRTGHSIFRRDQRTCPDCNAEWHGQAPPILPDTRQQVLDPVTAYQIVSMAQGVVERGTAATAVGSLGIPLAGKTGTTSDYKDAWFVGFSPDLVVGVWTGFDRPRNMGQGETGANVAAPVFASFMRQALADTPPTPFRIPAGVRLVRIDYMTGLLPGPTTTQTILEAFRPGTEPTNNVASASPFVFGGTDPIDPRVLSNFTGVAPESANTAPPQQQQQQQNQDQQDLNGLY
ncbi:MAG: penicillin-binding protein 1A [Magnetospirillum sp.]|nr:penicillin-binding protein 1A [Magnetospirillum sp.]